jgi:hypothetical protein
MGERCNRTAEVRGSIPLGSTKEIKNLDKNIGPKVALRDTPGTRKCGVGAFCEALRASTLGLDRGVRRHQLTGMQAANFSSIAASICFTRSTSLASFDIQSIHMPGAVSSFSIVPSSRIRM